MSHRSPNEQERGAQIMQYQDHDISAPRSGGLLEWVKTPETAHAWRLGYDTAIEAAVLALKLVGATESIIQVVGNLRRRIRGNGKGFE